MNRFTKTLLLAAALLPAAQLFFPGCATVMNGASQRVKLTSEPKAARVFVDGKERGQTPLTVELSRWGWHRVRLELDGYEPWEIPLVKRGNPMAEGNVWIGVAPIIVDVLTGAIFTLDVPKPLPDAVQLPTGDIMQDELAIKTTLKPDPNWRRVGQLQRK